MRARESLAFVRLLPGIGARTLDLVDDIEGREHAAQSMAVEAMKRATELRENAAGLRKQLAKALAPVYSEEEIAEAKRAADAKAPEVAGA